MKCKKVCPYLPILKRNIWISTFRVEGRKILWDNIILWKKVSSSFSEHQYHFFFQFFIEFAEHEKNLDTCLKRYKCLNNFISTISDLAFYKNTIHDIFDAECWSKYCTIFKLKSRMMQPKIFLWQTIYSRIYESRIGGPTLAVNFILQFFVGE